MWISRGIWRSLLRWSKFKNTNDIYGWCSVVEVITYKLGLVYRSNVNSRRHFIILKLHEQGYSNKEIANFLNSNGIKPPRTDSFSVRLVWVTIKKLKRRLEKEESMKINILSERLNKPS